MCEFMIDTNGLQKVRNRLKMINVPSDQPEIPFQVKQIANEMFGDNAATCASL